MPITLKATAVKARSSKLGTGQRAATHCSSKADNDEAFMAGQAAVRAAVDGETDKMVILVRAEGDTYECETGLSSFRNCERSQRNTF